MPKQYLDGAQVGSGFEHMSGERVPQGVRRHARVDASPLGGFSHGAPDHLLGDGNVCPPVVHHAWEQIRLRPHPTPVLAQGLKQGLTEKHIAVSSAFTLVDMDEHAAAVDVGNFEMAQLGAAQPGRIQRHQHGPVHQVAGALD